MLNSAVAYGKRGWRVHPLEPREKKPLVKAWQNQATTDEHKICEWFTKWPDANVGVATGKESDIFVIDIDGPDGERSWTQLQQEIPEIPEETLEQKTGRGRQLFYKYPPKRELRNKQNLLAGIDVRAEGGYVVVPPSIHPNGATYTWPYGDDTRIESAPVKLLNLITPPKRRPWDPPETPQTPKDHRPQKTTQTPETGTSVFERARLYLDEIPPAVQGSGGHDSLLWAARCLVIGFELSDSETRTLLEEWNRQCAPPWDLSNKEEAKDFYRKIEQARTIPFDKSPGWLKQELGLISNDEALASLGKQWAKNILDKDAAKPDVAVTTGAEKVPEKAREYQPFPTDAFPPAYAQYIRTAAEAYCVDEAVIGMAMLVTAGAAMGNVFRLFLKRKFIVPPTLWLGIIGESGTNKTAPLEAVVHPLTDSVPMDMIGNVLNCPVHRMVLSDATVEAVVKKLHEGPRGILCSRDELAAWLKTFNAYKNGQGGDEQTWLQFYNASKYIMDRKTNSEEVIIPRAAVSVIGGIQPDVVVECFTPARVASGLVSRVLVVSAPEQDIFWTEVEITEDMDKLWTNTIFKFRTTPFAAFNSQESSYEPHILQMEPTAKSRFVDYYNKVSRQLKDMDKCGRKYASKARTTVGRMAIPLHGLWCQQNEREFTSDVDLITMEGAIKIMTWALNEQLNVFGLASGECEVRTAHDMITKLKRNANADGVGKIRDIYKVEKKSADEFRGEVQPLVDKGIVEWINAPKTLYRITEQGKS